MKQKQLERKLQKKLRVRFGGAVQVSVEGRIIRVSGSLKRWEDIIEACSMCVIKQPGVHVVNDVVFSGGVRAPMRTPGFTDETLEGRRPDVLVIGGGVSGCSIARELTRWKLDVLLVEKEADLALQASGRNDGEVHPGVDLGRGTVKQQYVRKGNAMFDGICRELDVPFRRCGQYVCFADKMTLPLIRMYAWPIAEYWNTISAGAPDTDFIIYNIPQLAGVSLTLPLLQKMRENPRVIGVKNSSMPVQDIQIFRAAGGEDWVVFNGPDEQFVSGRAMGAAAGIGGTYAAMPELYLAMDQAFREGRMEDAGKLQYKANEIIGALCSCRANMYAVIKEILRMNGMDIGGVRAPLINVSEEDLPKIRACRKMIDEAVAGL